MLFLSVQGFGFLDEEPEEQERVVEPVKYDGLLETDIEKMAFSDDLTTPVYDRLSVLYGYRITVVSLCRRNTGCLEQPNG